MQRRVHGGVLLVIGLLAGSRWVQGQTLYYGTTSATQANNTVAGVNTNGSGGAVVFTGTGLFGNGAQRCSAVALDAGAGEVFFVDAGAGVLWSVFLDRTGLTLVSGGWSGTPVGLALDTVHHQIYLATSSATQSGNTVHRLDYSGDNDTVLFSATGPSPGGNGVQRCTALALDPANSMIFLADAGGMALWSMSLTGGSLTQVTGGLNAAPMDLALDVTNQIVYFTTSSSTTSANTVQKIVYNGTGRTTLLTATGIDGNGVLRCTALDLDVANARIYFSDSARTRLWSLPLGGGSPALVPAALSAATVKKVRLLPSASAIATGNPNLTYSNLVTHTANLLGYWPFSHISQANSILNGYTGSFYGGSAVGQPGSGPALLNMSNNTAVVLNGDAAFVNTSLVGGLSASGPNADQATIMGWFKLTTLPSFTGHFFTIAGESDYGNDLDLQIETDNIIKFYTDSGSCTTAANPLTESDLNVWHFVAATFTAGVSRSVYLDGVLVGSSVPGAHDPASAGAFAMGASDVFGGRYFQGVLDEVAIFNRELTPTEVASFYAVGTGQGFVPMYVQQIGPKLVVTWTDPLSAFSLQAAPAVTGTYTNLPGAASPYTNPITGFPAYFRLKSN